MSSLPEGEVESSAWPVLVVLLHAGSAAVVSVDEQVCPPRRGRLQWPGPTAATDRGAARIGRKDADSGGTRSTRPGAVASTRRQTRPAQTGGSGSARTVHRIVKKMNRQDAKSAKIGRRKHEVK